MGVGSEAPGSRGRRDAWFEFSSNKPCTRIALFLVFAIFLLLCFNDKNCLHLKLAQGLELRMPSTEMSSRVQSKGNPVNGQVSVCSFQVQRGCRFPCIDIPEVSWVANLGGKRPNHQGGERKIKKLRQVSKIKFVTLWISGSATCKSTDQASLMYNFERCSLHGGRETEAGLGSGSL